MDLINCTCRECGASLGQFINFWTQIGRAFFSPLFPVDVDATCRPSGDIRIGERQSLVEDCRLRDVNCSECDARVGIKCLSSPVNHVLDQNQLLMKQSCVVFTSARSGGDVELIVKRVLSLKGPTPATQGPDPQSHGTYESYGGDRTPESPVDVIDLCQIQADLENQREDINRIDSTGFKIISAFDSAVDHLNREVASLKDVTKDTRQDLVGYGDDLASVKTELGVVKQIANDRVALASVEQRIKLSNDDLAGIRRELNTSSIQLRKELATAKSDLLQARRDAEDAREIATDSISTVRENAKEIASLRNELKQLKQQIAQDRNKRPEPTGAPFPSRELDILTTNIAKIGNRASHIETLQMEFEIFKGRVGRLETDRYAPFHAATQQDDCPLEESDLPPPPRSRNKRPSTGLEIPTSSPAGPVKRQAFLDARSDDPSVGSDTAWDWTEPSRRSIHLSTPEPKNSKGKVAKLTKSGSIDKRTTRNRQARSLGGRANDSGSARRMNAG